MTKNPYLGTDFYDDYQATTEELVNEIESLKKENQNLKAQNYVLKDAQLRTYDGLAQRADMAEELATALRALVDDHDKRYGEISLRNLKTAREALAKMEKLT